MVDEMTDGEKLAVLVTEIRRVCERLCESQEPGIEDLRYRIENALLKIGVEPYTPWPVFVLETLCLEEEAGRAATEDEAHYSRYGF